MCEEVNDWINTNAAKFNCKSGDSTSKSCLTQRIKVCQIKEKTQRAYFPLCL